MWPAPAQYIHRPLLRCLCFSSSESLDSAHLHGFRWREGRVHQPRKYSGSRKRGILQSVCVSCVSLPELKMRIQVDGWINEPIQGFRKIQSKDLILYTVCQPVEKDVPLHLSIPLTLHHQSAKLNGVVSNTPLPLLQLREHPGHLFARHGSIENLFEFLRKSFK